jgi:hypothetical protein
MQRASSGCGESQLKSRRLYSWSSITPQGTTKVPEKTKLSGLVYLPCAEDHLETGPLIQDHYLWMQGPSAPCWPYAWIDGSHEPMHVQRWRGGRGVPCH